MLYNVTGTLQLAWTVVRWDSLLKIFQVDRSPSFSLFITLNMFSCMQVIAILMDTLHLQWLCFACRFVYQQTVFIRRFSELNRTTPVIVTYFVHSGIWVFPNVRSGEVGALNTPYTCLRLVLVFRCVLETLIARCDWSRICVSKYSLSFFFFFYFAQITSIKN